MYRVMYIDKRDKLVVEILNIINKSKDEIVYWQDLSAVGCRLWIGENYLEEVVGGWYRWNNKKLTREQHEQIRPVLYKKWKEQGKNFKKGER